MLDEYKAMKGSLYKGATLENVPWIFAYMSNNQSLYGRYIKENSDLFKTLIKLDNISFEPGGELVKIVNSNDEYFKLTFAFVGHKKAVRDSKN